MTQQTAIVKRVTSRFRFIGEIIAELKKVVWLSKREGLFVGALAYGFTQLVDKVFLGG